MIKRSVRFDFDSRANFDYSSEYSSYVGEHISWLDYCNIATGWGSANIWKTLAQFSDDHFYKDVDKSFDIIVKSGIPETRGTW